MAYRYFTAIGLALFLMLTAGQARAACTSPSAAEGDIVYNEAYHMFQFCAGTTWTSFTEINPGAGGSGCSNPSQPEGFMFYSNDYHVLQFCNGSNWIAVGGSASSSSSCPLGSVWNLLTTA